MRELHGRTAVVTGAAGGIGSRVAHRLARSGMSLALVDRDAEGLGALADALPAPTRVTTHVADLAEVTSFPALADAVAGAHDGVHVLVSNAGLTVHGRFADHTPADLDRVLDVDLRAGLHLVHALLPHLRAAEEAHVVLVASMAALLAFPYQSAYSAAKFGLRGFGHALRIELSAEAIGVTTVLPGTIATGFLAAARSHDVETSARLAGLMRRHGTSPERVAAAVERGVRRNRGEVRVGWDAHLVAALGRLAPRLLPGLLGLAYRRGPDGGAR